MRNNRGIGGSLLFYILGLASCVLPPAICTLLYFPLWTESGGKIISGGAVLLLAVAFLPLFRYLSRILSSGASYILWLLIFLLFFMLSRIADEVTVIAFVGFVGNSIGALLMHVGKRYGSRK